MVGITNIGSQNSPVHSFKRHSHALWEITYYYDGYGKNITGNSEIPFSPGTIICQPPNVLHEDISEKGYKNIFFSVQSFNIPTDSPLVLHDTANKDFLYILKQMYYEFHAGAEHEIVTNALLNVLKQYIIMFNSSKDINNYTEMIERELINNLSNAKFKIMTALKNIPLCPDHARRMFKNEVGSSPQEYLIKIRINYSLSLLRSSTHSIKDIASMSGFDDQCYFSRIFKKQMGMSPVAWRRENRGH